MSALLQVFLFEVQRLVVGHTKLFLYQVHAYHFFRNRMFYLQTGIHFQEVEIAVLVDQELNRTGSFVMHSLCRSHSCLTHFLTQFRSDERRRSFFHNFLVTALDRTFTFKKMYGISEIITQNLEFDMMRFFYKFFQINGIVTKRRHRFRTGCVIGFFHFVHIVNQAHAFTSTTHGSFQHDRITDLITDFFGLFHTLQRLFCTRNDRYTGCNHVLAGRNLVTHCIHRLRIRTNKDNTFLTAATCKL